MYDTTAVVARAMQRGKLSKKYPTTPDLDTRRALEAMLASVSFGFETRNKTARLRVLLY